VAHQAGGHGTGAGLNPFATGDKLAVSGEVNRMIGTRRQDAHSA
jgi:hypothetical protein